MRPKTLWGLRSLGFWPWDLGPWTSDLPRHSIHHDTTTAFPNNVPMHCKAMFEVFAGCIFEVYEVGIVFMCIQHAMFEVYTACNVWCVYSMQCLMFIQHAMFDVYTIRNVWGVCSTERPPAWPPWPPARRPRSWCPAPPAEWSGRRGQGSSPLRAGRCDPWTCNTTGRTI